MGGGFRNDTRTRPGHVVPWVLSATSEEALREEAARVQASLAACFDHAEIAARLAAVPARAPVAEQHRAVLVGNRAELTSGLRALAEGGRPSCAVLGAVRPPGGTVFVFPGQGSQWAGMARDLLASSPVFARHLRACADALGPHVGWSLTDVLTGRDSAPPFDRVDVVQPALFAMMVSLARLWEAAGVRPDAVIGHSQGEIAAAHVSGALTLGDAAAIVALRARALRAIAGTGAMASLPLPAGEVRARLAGHGGRISVGAVNGPTMTVVSGESAALAGFLAAYREDGVDVRDVRVDYASHSPQVERVRESLLDRLSAFRPRASAVAFYSTVTGGRLDTARLTAGYWYRNLRQTVELGRAVEAAVCDGHRVFVECSPHPILVEGVRGFAAQAPGQAADVVATGTLRRDHGDPRQFFISLARVHVAGRAVRWPEVIDAFRAA